MCLMVYLGSDAPVAGFADVAVGGIGLDPDVVSRPPALAGKAHVYRICDRVPTGWNCSCIFLDDALPWEPPPDPTDPDVAVRIGAYAGLRRIAEAAVAVDPEAAILSCWAGEEERPVTVERQLAPEGLVPDRYIFDEVGDAGSGGNPPVLIRLTTGDGA